MATFKTENKCIDKEGNTINRTLFVRDVATEEEAYLWSKRHFILNQNEVTFIEVSSAQKI